MCQSVSMRERSSASAPSQVWVQGCNKWRCLMMSSPGRPERSHQYYCDFGCPKKAATQKHVHVQLLQCYICILLFSPARPNLWEQALTLTY